MNEPEDTDRRKLDRRSFLKGMGLTAGAAGAAVLGMATAAEAALSATTATGYRESEHVLRVYDLAKRF